MDGVRLCVQHTYTVYESSVCTLDLSGRNEDVGFEFYPHLACVTRDAMRWQHRVWQHPRLPIETIAMRQTLAFPAGRAHLRHLTLRYVTLRYLTLLLLRLFVA